MDKNVKVKIEFTIDYTNKLTYDGDDVRVAEALVKMILLNYKESSS